MSAGRANLEVDQGADFNFSMQILDCSENPVNLTSYTFLAQIKKNFSDTDPTASIANSVPDQTVEANVGIVNFSLSKTVSTAMPVDPPKDSVREPTIYIYDIFMTTPGDAGITERILEGALILSHKVT